MKKKKKPSVCLGEHMKMKAGYFGRKWIIKDGDCFRERVGKWRLVSVWDKMRSIENRTNGGWRTERVRKMAATVCKGTVRKEKIGERERGWLCCWSDGNICKRMWENLAEHKENPLIYQYIHTHAHARTRTKHTHTHSDMDSHTNTYTDTGTENMRVGLKTGSGHKEHKMHTPEDNEVHPVLVHVIVFLQTGLYNCSVFFKRKHFLIQSGILSTKKLEQH